MSQAETFHALHAGPDPLLIPNGWDAVSCKLMETLGAKAVATSSAAVAWSHGYADGDFLPVELMLQTVRNVARVVGVPLSADIEGGYSDDPATVGETVAKVIEAGAVGVNIEDRGEAPDLLARKIAAARAAAERVGVNLYINARTDLWLRGLMSGQAAVNEALRRAALYEDAGASGFFAAGVADPAEIRALVEGTRLKLNVMTMGSVGDAGAMKALGVARVSSATSPGRVAWRAMREAMGPWIATGDNAALAEAAGGPFNYNALFKA